MIRHAPDGYGGGAGFHSAFLRIRLVTQSMMIVSQPVLSSQNLFSFLPLFL